MIEESIDTSLAETKDSFSNKNDINSLIEEYERINLEQTDDTEQ